MSGGKNFINKVRTAAKKKYLYLPHAIGQMSRVDRMITTKEVRVVIENGEIVENYPDDSRGHSCLICGQGKNGRPIHIVCSPKEEFLAIITAYIPNPDEWTQNFKERIKK